MKLSRNLKIFAGLALGATLIFDHFYGTWEGARLGWLGASFGLALFFSALLLGSTDKQSNVRYDLGFAYHFTTYLIVTGISLISTIARGHPVFVFDFDTSDNRAELALPWILIWGLLGVLPHYIASRAKIKGIDKKDLFK